jgi:hypothetical protein
MCCADISGNQKMKLLVIGKAKNHSHKRAEGTNNQKGAWVDTNFFLKLVLLRI